jgi:hypothetical protein
MKWTPRALVVVVLCLAFYLLGLKAGRDSQLRQDFLIASYNNTVLDKSSLVDPTLAAYLRGRLYYLANKVNQRHWGPHPDRGPVDHDDLRGLVIGKGAAPPEAERSQMLRTLK